MGLYAICESVRILTNGVMEMNFLTLVVSLCVVGISSHPYKLVPNLNVPGAVELSPINSEDDNTVHSAVHLRIARQTDQTIRITPNGDGTTRISIRPNNNQNNNDPTTINIRENDNPDYTINIRENDKPDSTINIQKNDNPDYTINIRENDNPDSTINIQKNDNPDSTITIRENDEPNTININRNDEPTKVNINIKNDESDDKITVQESGEPQTVVVQESRQPQTVVVRETTQPQTVVVQQAPEPQRVVIQEVNPPVKYVTVQEVNPPQTVYVQQAPPQPQTIYVQRPTTSTLYSSPRNSQRTPLLPARSETNNIYLQPPSGWYVVQQAQPDQSDDCPEACAAVIDPVCGETSQKEMEEFDNMCQLKVHNCHTRPVYPYYRKGKCPQEVQTMYVTA